MTHIVSEVTAYDKKRWKVTLDEGAVAFLLYRGEMKQAGLEVPREAAASPAVLTEEQFRNIQEIILLPRAKKRALYYLKNGDKTEYQIRKKLAEGLYPEEIIAQVLDFLRHYRLADDDRYTENYVNQLKSGKSRREIEAKLYARGLKGEAVREALEQLSKEDEYEACEKALSKRHSGDRKKDYAYLARRGFSHEAIQHAFRSAGETSESFDDQGF